MSAPWRDKVDKFEAIEQGISDLKKASRTVLAEANYGTIEQYCLSKAQRGFPALETDYRYTNFYLISLYKLLSKDKFDAVQAIKGLK